uniref:Uncharacterized protein n=1 Tax=Physcomitrium patens TaxID=3218 RepID=A0A2K1IXJ1_PHYPA|nr:hypothetical protein PHYPA_023815 [Physcomitrium patens]
MRPLGPCWSAEPPSSGSVSDPTGIVGLGFSPPPRISRCPSPIIFERLFKLRNAFSEVEGALHWRLMSL